MGDQVDLDQIYEHTHGQNMDSDQYRFENWPKTDNPDACCIVWDMGSDEASRFAAEELLKKYGIGTNSIASQSSCKYFPVAGAGEEFKWPTQAAGRISSSHHAQGLAVDMKLEFPVTEFHIHQSNVTRWPSQLEIIAETSINVTSINDSLMFVKFLKDVESRSAFLDLFLGIKSAARDGFNDPNHYRAANTAGVGFTNIVDDGTFKCRVSRIKHELHVLSQAVPLPNRGESTKCMKWVAREKKRG